MLNLIILSHQTAASNSGVLHSIKTVFFDGDLLENHDTRLYFFHTDNLHHLINFASRFNKENTLFLFNGGFSLCILKVLLLIFINNVTGYQQVFYWHETAISLRRLLGKQDVNFLIKVRRHIIAFILGYVLRSSNNYHLAVSKQSKQLIMFMLGTQPEKIFIIHEAIDFEKYIHRDDSVKNSFNSHSSLRICGAGLLDYRKGFDIFVSIAETFSTWNGQTIEYSWFGGQLGSIEPRIQTYINIKLKKTSIQLPGFMKPLDKELRNQNIFLLTSRDDPFPIVALEALASGLAVFCFDSTGISEILPQEFVCHDQSEMIGKVKDYMMNDHTYRYPPNYFQNIAKRFDKKIFLHKWTIFIRTCLGRNNYSEKPW